MPAPDILRTAAMTVGMLDLPQELVHYIAAHIPLQARLEFHLLCKKLYSMLLVPIPGLNTLKGHTHAMLLLMCATPSLQPTEEDFGWPVFMEIETKNPSQVVKVARQSQGIVCVRTEPEGRLRFLREEQLYRKMVLSKDVVHRASLVIGEDKQMRLLDLSNLTLKMSRVLAALPVKYSGEITVYTRRRINDVVLRKVTFGEEVFYFDSRLVHNPITKPVTMQSATPIPASACAMSLVVKEDLYTPYM